MKRDITILLVTKVIIMIEKLSKIEIYLKRHINFHEGKIIQVFTIIEYLKAKTIFISR